MKINGVECMYRSFEGYNVSIRALNVEKEEFISVSLYVEGKFNGTQDIENTAKETFNRSNPGYMATKITNVEKVEKRIAMSIADFVKYGFEIDENNKPIEK